MKYPKKFKTKKKRNRINIPANIRGLEAIISFLARTNVQTCTIASIVIIMIMLCNNKGVSNGWPNLKNNQVITIILRKMSGGIGFKYIDVK